MENEKTKKCAAGRAPRRGTDAPDAKPCPRRDDAKKGIGKPKDIGQHVQRLSYGDIHHILDPYVDAVRRLYECSCREKLRFNLDVDERRGNDGLLTVRAALLTSRDEADGRELREGKVTERKWHIVFRKERRLTEYETLDVRDFCTSFIEWCTFLFTDRKALVRELNVGKRRKFLWFRLP